MGEKQKATFLILKERLTIEPILAVPDLFKPFDADCDACGERIGAALHQNDHLMAYES